MIIMTISIIGAILIILSIVGIIYIQNKEWDDLYERYDNLNKSRLEHLRQMTDEYIKESQL